MSYIKDDLSTNLNTLVQGEETTSEFGLNVGDFIRVKVNDTTIFYSDKIVEKDSDPYLLTENKKIQQPSEISDDPIIQDWDQFNVYKNSWSDIDGTGFRDYYLKMNNFDVGEDGGTITIDYLNQLHEFTNSETSGWLKDDGTQNSWILSERSPSGKEVRLKLKSSEPIASTSPIIPSFNSAMNTIIITISKWNIY